MNAKKIVFVTNNFTPYSGGVVRSIQAITDQLRAQGHEVRIITLDFGTKETDPDYVIRIPAWFTFTYRGNRMAVPRQAAAHIKQILKEFQPDIVHVHHPFLLGPIAVTQARALNIKTVFTYHTMYEQYAHYALLPSWFAKPFITYKVKNFCTLVDHVIAPSNYIAQRLQKWGVTHYSIIPSPIDHIFERSEQPQKIIQEPIKLLVVSRFVPEKNLTTLLDACALLDNRFTLTLVGFGYYYRRLQRYAYSTLKLSNNKVHFVEKPTQEQLLEQYQNAQVFLFSSVTDTQAIVLAEAMSQGLPIISLHGPGQEDIIKQSVNGYLVDSVQEMAIYIERIAHDSNLYKKLSSHAFETARNYYSAQITQRLMDLYEQVCKGDLK